MKHAIILIAGVCLGLAANAQVDVISTNIYQNEGRLGINTQSPANLIEIKLSATGNLHEKGLQISRNDGYLRLINGTNYDGEFQPRISGLADSDNSPGLTIVGTASKVDDSARGIVLRAGEYAPMSDGNVLAVDNYTTTLMAVSAEGNLGLGTTSPAAKLQVEDGDIYIADINKGIIMKSPDGNCWRGVLNNEGALTFAPTTCPEEEVMSISQKSSEVRPGLSVAVYPNPTENQVTVRIQNGTSEKLQYCIYDLTGKSLDKGRIENDTQTFDLSSYKSGMYLLKIQDKKGETLSTTRIIKE